MGLEVLFSKKPLWDVVCQAVQTELGTVKIKPIKNKSAEGDHSQQE